MGISALTRRAVFLDRDGTLNRAVVRNGKPHPPATAQELEILPGVREGLGALRAAGCLLIVVTNQPDVAKGTLTQATVDEIHARLVEALPIDEVLVCPHDDRTDCQCRKPKAGMVIDAARRHGIDLAASFMIGDRWRDIEAGRTAGCRTVFIDRHYNEALQSEPDAVVTSFEDAAAWVLSTMGTGS
ncbi:MAG: HAD family hydrolase [Acidobacteriota bacterium]